MRSAKICEIARPDGERRAGHDAAAIFAEKHPAQNRRDVDRRGIERKELRGFPVRSTQ